MSWLWPAKRSAPKQYPSPYGQYDAKANTGAGGTPGEGNVQENSTKTDKPVGEGQNQGAPADPAASGKEAETPDVREGPAMVRPVGDSPPVSSQSRTKFSFNSRYKPMETQHEDPAEEGEAKPSSSQTMSSAGPVGEKPGPTKPWAPVAEAKKLSYPFFKDRHNKPTTSTTTTTLKQHVSLGRRALNLAMATKQDAPDDKTPPIPTLTESSFVDSRPALPPAPPPSTILRTPSGTAQALFSEGPQRGLERSGPRVHKVQTARTRARLFLHRKLPGLYGARGKNPKSKMRSEGSEVETGPWVRKEEGTVVQGSEG